MWTRRNYLKAMLAVGTTTGLGLPLGRAGEQDPDVILRITAKPDVVPIWKGEPTAVFRFAGEVMKGRQGALRPSGSYLGPTLELRRGERVRIHFENRLDEASIIHWHGMLVPERADGHPRFAVAPGGSYLYEFTVNNPAGTYLYHPHPHGRTGFQLYHGLAGMLIVREPGEAEMGLPQGPYELPLVIQDRRAGRDNRLVFKRMMMDDMSGVLGDVVLVNGRPDAAFKVAPRPYRLRILNASNARIYKLAWSDDRPLAVIGTDNGLLDASHGPQSYPYVMLGPTERVEVLEDFGQRKPGVAVALMSREFSVGGGMMGGMMSGGGMMGGGGMTGADQGQEMLIAQFTIAREQPVRGESLRLPAARPLPEPRVKVTTRLAFAHMRGSLNGRTFDMKNMSAVADDERLPLGEPVLWTFENSDGMMDMPHPMHIHGVRFRVIERRRGRKSPSGVAEGLVDSGFKDTVLVFAGERVSVQLVPTEPGLFMYHCHNLEHEDGGMMRNFLAA
jgi:bilirubin oxidase